MRRFSPQLVLVAVALAAGFAAGQAGGSTASLANMKTALHNLDTAITKVANDYSAGHLTQAQARDAINGLLHQTANLTSHMPGEILGANLRQVVLRYGVITEWLGTARERVDHKFPAWMIKFALDQANDGRRDMARNFP
jgi:hypothetical protein